MNRLIALLLILLPCAVWGQQYTWNTLPAHTYPDSMHHPFILGVASSEPDTNYVYLWTYAEPDSFTQPTVPVNWKLAADSTFNSLVDSGTVHADSSHSWTVTFKVAGLAPDTYYWYRFDDGQGRYSVTGRTRTLPVNSSKVKLGVISCNNIVAFYNTFERLAERNDLNAIVHLGDFAYDKLNQNRSVRYPDPAPTIRCGLEERRQRDYLHLLDPDLRHVRQMHPFMYLWDNHDVQKEEPDSVKDVCRNVFREYTGQALLDSSDVSRQYRKVSFGPLVDMFIIDVQWTQDKRDSLNGYETYLGVAQHNWLLNGLQNSTATWKLIGNQKLVTPFSVQGLEALIPDGVNADEKSWDGFFEERDEILEFIRDNDIDNVMFLSGDAHFAVVADMPLDPFDSLVYNGATGDGSICVEFLPSGISSPNIDERGIPYSLGPTLTQISKDLNPHHLYAEFMDNGYGILEIVPDSITAQVWLLDARTVNNNQYLADERKLKTGVNHWERNAPSGIPGQAGPAMGITAVYPNPTTGELNVEYLSQTGSKATLEIVDVQGKVWFTGFDEARVGTNLSVLDLNRLAAGSYLLKLSTNKDWDVYRFVKE